MNHRALVVDVTMPLRGGVGFDDVRDRIETDPPALGALARHVARSRL